MDQTETILARLIGAVDRALGAIAHSVGLESLDQRLELYRQAREAEDHLRAKSRPEAPP